MTLPAGPAGQNEEILTQVRDKAARAREKYPEHPDNTHHDWLRAAMEELGECSRIIHNGGMSQAEMDRLRQEVIQLSATALNWAAHGCFSPTAPGQRP